MTQKIVVNRCYGGFGLSREAMVKYGSLKGFKVWPEDGRFGLTEYWIVPPEDRPANQDNFHELPRDERVASNKAHSEARLFAHNIERDDPALIEVVELLGMRAASDRYAALEIVEIPDGVDWVISEYDGMESVAEKHRTW